MQVKGVEVEHLMTVKEVAHRLQVPVSWLYERTRHNSIKYIKLGKYIRFTEEMLEEIVRDGLK